MRKQNVIRAVLSMICLAGMLAVPCSSRAITYSINTGNSALSGFTGPYANVNVTLVDSTHATITFTSLTFNSGAGIYLFGDGGSVAVNVNGSFTVTGGAGAIAGSNSGTGFTPGPYTIGSGNEDGFGSFNLRIDSFDGYTHSANSVTFGLTDTSGTWSGASDVLAVNSGGWRVGAHIFPALNPADASINQYGANTGFAVGKDETIITPPVPDGGSTVALLGFAVLGLGGLRRIFSRN